MSPETMAQPLPVTKSMPTWEVYEVAAGFREWQRDLMNLPARKDVHVGVVAAGTCARLGGRILTEGLLQISAALSSDGRVLLVCNEEDEVVLGGKLEDPKWSESLGDWLQDVLEAQEYKAWERISSLIPLEIGVGRVWRPSSRP